MRRIDHTTQELRGQFIAKEYPLRQAEPLSDNQELVFVGEVEQRVVEQHHGSLMLLEQSHK